LTSSFVTKIDRYQWIGLSVLMLALILMGACSSAPASSSGKAPIRIGISISFSGDFSDDGKLFAQGYQLWADTVNQHGGLLGRPVKLDMLSDASSTAQVQTNYQKLMTVDHVDLVFGPFSSLLTKPASDVANRYGYAMVEGAGTGESVFNRELHNLFCVSLSSDQYLTSFANYMLSLPPGLRPKTAVYATADDPFAQPQVQIAQQMLEKGGIRTVGSAPGAQIVWPAETTDYTPVAQKIIDANGQLVVLGTTAVQDAIALTQAFKNQHFNPQALIEASGPDQVDQFKKAIVAPNGIFVPNSWWPGYPDPQGQSQQMVQAYTAHYHVPAALVSSDVAQAYSVGQVVQEAVEATRSLDNAKLIAYLHSGATFHTVQGTVKFDASGQNIAALPVLFQWQNGALVPVYPDDVAQANPIYPKPQW
jgi:branched-chain amino acid transport system substrate-binding protein